MKPGLLAGRCIIERQLKNKTSGLKKESLQAFFFFTEKMFLGYVNKWLFHFFKIGSRF